MYNHQSLDIDKEIKLLDEFLKEITKIKPVFESEPDGNLKIKIEEIESKLNYKISQLKEDYKLDSSNNTSQTKFLKNLSCSINVKKQRNNSSYIYKLSNSLDIIISILFVILVSLSLKSNFVIIWFGLAGYSLFLIFRRTFRGFSKSS